MEMMHRTACSLKAFDSIPNFSLGYSLGIPDLARKTYGFQRSLSTRDRLLGLAPLKLFVAGIRYVSRISIIRDPLRQGFIK
jgi:hypothetical protein